VIFDVRGRDDAPTLVLIGSLGTSVAMWDRQLPALTPLFRVVRVEHPGHDGAPAPPGPYTVEFLGRRVLEVMDEVGADRPAVAGLSLGGIIALWLGAHHSERIGQLVACCTAPWLGPPEMWTDRAAAVRSDGVGPQVVAALSRWFTPSFLAQHPEVAREITVMMSSVDREGYAACCEAIATNDLRPDIGRIQAPTLVVCGADDPVVGPDVGAATAAAIPGASLTVIEQARHLANIERPDDFNQAVLGHLQAAGAGSSTV
jgi:3-oxoadipate enol-lactonase